MNVYAYKRQHPKKEGWALGQVVARDDLDFYRLLDSWNWQTDRSGFVYVSDPSVPKRWASCAEIQTLHQGQDRSA